MSLVFPTAHIATVLGCLMIIQCFLHRDITDKIFQILIWCARHLNNGGIYAPVVVKMLILNEFTFARLSVIQTYTYDFDGSRV